MPAITLGGLLVAVLALLLAIALFLIAEAVARLIGPRVPVIGGWLATEIRAAARVVTAALQLIWDSSIATVAWFFVHLAAWAWSHLYWISTALVHTGRLAVQAEQQAAHALASIGPAVAHGEAAAIAAAEAWAGAGLSTLLHEAQHLYNLAIAHANAVGAAAETDAANLFHSVGAEIGAAEALAAAATAALSSRVASLEAAVTGDVTSLIANIKADLNIAVATALADAQAAEEAAVQAAAQAAGLAIGSAGAALDQAAHDLVIGPWLALLPELQGIAAALDPAQVGALGLLPALTGPVPLTLPGILALLFPAVGAIATEVENCLVPNCGPLKSLGSIINGLESIGIRGLLMALAAQAVLDPEDAAREVIDVTGWVPSLLTELTDAVLG